MLQYNGRDGEPLKSFIIEVTQHLLNRASQRDRLTYHTFDILKGKSDDKIFERIPEIYEGKRVIHPAETYILIGYCKSEEHSEWIDRNGLYNFRMNTVRGSLRLEPEVTAASYILFHSEGGLISRNIRRIIKKGPRVLSKESIINLGYPSPGNDYYLVYEIEKGIEEAFNNQQWDISKLEKYQSGRTSGIPVAVSLLELMKVKV